MRPVDDAFGKEVIKPVEEALVNTCLFVDNHYTYTAKRTEDDYLDDDASVSDGDDVAIEED